MKKETRLRLEKLLQESVEREEIAGGSLCVEEEGEEVCYLEAGYEDLEQGRPIRRDTIYRLYSMSKPITAAAAFRLMEQGLIDFAEPVSKYLPGFREQMVQESEGKKVPVQREMVIKDLLDMTSGLMYPGYSGSAGRETDAVFEELDKRLFTQDPMSTYELANRLGQAPLAFQPGKGFLYSSSADVLGAVMEKASGMSFSGLLEKFFFSPLGMRDTGFSVPEASRQRLAVAYEKTQQGLKPYLGNHLGILNRMDRKPGFESGGAGLVSTIDDFMKFSRMLLEEGHYPGGWLLRPATVRLMTQGALPGRLRESFTEQFCTLPGYNYGNLMRVRETSSGAWYLGSVGEYGWDGWLGCYMSNDPVKKRSILFMTQLKDAGTLPILRKLRNVIYAET